MEIPAAPERLTLPDKQTDADDSSPVIAVSVFDSATPVAADSGVLANRLIACVCGGAARTAALHLSARQDETRGDTLFEEKTNLIGTCKDVANVIMTPVCMAAVAAWLPDSEEHCGNYLPV